MKHEEKNTRAMTTRHRRVLNKTFITECVLALERYERTNERANDNQVQGDMGPNLLLCQLIAY